MGKPQAAAAVLAGAGLCTALAWAQPPRLTVDCESWANFSGWVAEVREVGAPLKGVLSYLNRIQPVGMLRAALEREAKRVYGEGRTPAEARQDGYRRCLERLGEIEVEG